MGKFFYDVYLGELFEWSWCYNSFWLLKCTDNFICIYIRILTTYQIHHYKFHLNAFINLEKKLIGYVIVLKPYCMFSVKSFKTTYAVAIFIS